MFHPFLGEMLQEEFGNIQSVGMDKIHEKIGELNKRIAMAAQMGNTMVVQQLQSLRDEYQMVLQDRMRTEIAKQEEERRAKLERTTKSLEEGNSRNE